jgi:hypothetical protein
MNYYNPKFTYTHKAVLKLTISDLPGSINQVRKSSTSFPGMNKREIRRILLPLRLEDKENIIAGRN